MDVLTVATTVMNSKIDASLLSAVNRSKLMKLAEGIKTKKKPGHNKKSALNFKKDPGYTNIEHLVFGTYRPRGSPSSNVTSPTTVTEAARVPNNCDHQLPQQQQHVTNDKQFSSLPIHLNGHNEVTDYDTELNGRDYCNDDAVVVSPVVSPTNSLLKASRSNGSFSPILNSGSHASTCLTNGTENSDVTILAARQPDCHVDTPHKPERELLFEGNRVSYNGESSVNGRPLPAVDLINSEVVQQTVHQLADDKASLQQQHLQQLHHLVLKSESCPDMPSKDSVGIPVKIVPAELKVKAQHVANKSQPRMTQQRHSTRVVATNQRSAAAGNRLTSSFGPVGGGGGGHGRELRPATSGVIQAQIVQTLCKVSAANPARPTLSARVKLTVNANGAPQAAATAPSGGEAPKSASASVAQLRNARSSVGPPKRVASSNRNASATLTNGNVKSATAGPAVGRGNVTRTDRPRLAPSAAYNFIGPQSRSSSISSLGSRKHPGSTSSLECGGSSGVQNTSTSRPTSAKSEESSVAARRSFHVGTYQRSVSAKDSINTAAVPSTRSPNSIPKQTGRMSLWSPVANGNTGVTRLPTPSQPTERQPATTVAVNRVGNKNCRIPQYKFPKKKLREAAVVGSVAIRTETKPIASEGQCTLGNGFANGCHPAPVANPEDLVNTNAICASPPTNDHSSDMPKCTREDARMSGEPAKLSEDGDVSEDALLVMATSSDALLTSDAKIVPLSRPTDSSFCDKQRTRWRPPLPVRSVSLAVREVSRPSSMQRGRRLSELSVGAVRSPQDDVGARRKSDDGIVLTQRCDDVANVVEDVSTQTTPTANKTTDEQNGDCSGHAERTSVGNVNVVVVVADNEPCAVEDNVPGEVALVSVGNGAVVRSTSQTRSVPKSVRRLKAASSPVFTESRVDAWVSEGDLRRPWSQICTQQDAECLVNATASNGSTRSMSLGITEPSSSQEATDRQQQQHEHQQTANLFARFSSMRQPANVRTPPPPPLATATAVEGVLQKFRKSFSARFYKKVKSAESPTSTSVSKSCRHASFSSYLGEGLSSDAFDTTRVGGGGGDDDGAFDGSEQQLKIANGVGTNFDHLSVSDVSATESSDGAPGSAGIETVFRLGPIIWRSSKERKEKTKKSLKKGSALDSSAVAAISTPDLNNGLTESCNSLDAHTDTTSCCPSKRLSSSTTPLLTGVQRNDGSGASPAHCPSCADNEHSAGVSPLVLRRRAPISTSLRFARLKRPLSDQSSLHGSIIMPNNFEITRNGDNTLLRNGDVDQTLYSSTNVCGLPTLVIVRRQKKLPLFRWSKGRSNLRRSVSQPLEMEKLDALNVVSTISNNPGGLSDQEDNGHDLSMASSEEEIGSDAENNGKGNFGTRRCRHSAEFSEPVVYAEALWDHVTMDTEELAFKAGNLIEVLDDCDPKWWWGMIGNKAGWFPASFVRPRVNQEDTVEDCVAKMSDGTLCPSANRKMSISLLSNDQVRTNVIMEIVSTEKDFVRHLKDVCEGYLKQVRKRPDMFSDDRIGTIFGNIEQLYAFQSNFVSKLELCINWEHPHLSQIGSCFTENREGFEMYSEYCNNHSQAVIELQELYTNTKYAHFFEACRLLQDMIDISLDGFLLTPVQKICKYPLQLAELLKYTRADHLDRAHVEEALETMRSVAQYINERKRRMECLEKLAAWQLTVEYWEGANLLEKSSELIYSGEVSKVTTAWSRDFTFFLFDHQVIICKKDLLKRNSYTYKGRFDMDVCDVVDIPDGKDASTGLVLKNAWKIFCSERAKWLVFATKTADEKQRWMKSFENERRRVSDDRRQGFVISEKAKRTATMVVQTRRNPKKPKAKENKNANSRRSGRANGRYVISSKSGSLPSNLLLSTNPNKKSNSSSNNATSSSSGWFHFGSNKKSKR